MTSSVRSSQLRSPPATGSPGGRIPGTRTTCAVLTVLNILLAWPVPTLTLRVLVLPVYFAFLAWFFWTTGRGRESLDGQPLNLIRWGFFVLCLGYTVGALIHFSGYDLELATLAYVREACENGALFLLGVTLIAYGLMLWIPLVIEANEVLSRDLDEQRSELVAAETERDELELRLLEADRRVLLGELAASIAHDLRNPLAIVVGTAQSLCRRQRTPEQLAEHTDVIGRNIDKACRTLDTLIDLGRPRALSRSHIDGRALVEDVFALVRTQARQRTLSLRCAMASPAPTFYGDDTLLAQALLNLVLNAIQAARDGDEIVVRARRVGLEHAVLAVEDSGPGIPGPRRMGEFTPFQTTKRNGTGLGLWSCSRIAEELDGALALYPRHRGGTRVVMLLPSVEPTDAVERPEPNREVACPTAAS